MCLRAEMAPSGEIPHTVALRSVPAEGEAKIAAGGTSRKTAPQPTRPDAYAQINNAGVGVGEKLTFDTQSEDDPRPLRGAARETMSWRPPRSLIFQALER
jgi:hypothetical protein